MRTLLRNLRTVLQNEEAASSFVPLLVVIAAIVLLSTGVIYLILRTLRAPTGPEAAEGKFTPESNLLYLNPWARLRHFFSRRWLSGSDNSNRSILAELDVLRAKNARLEKENSHLRELHAKALKKNTELAEELRTMETSINQTSSQQREIEQSRDKLRSKYSETDDQLKNLTSQLDRLREEHTKALEAANEKRQRAQERSDEIETQLREFIADLEKTYRAGTQGDPTKLSARLSAFFGEGENSTVETEEASKSGLLQQKEAELQKMKEVLKVAKQQIVFLTQRLQTKSEPRKAA